MVNFFKEHWFGFLLSCLVFVCMVIAIIVGVAPHNDAKMRGFTPCTFELAENLSQGDKPGTVEVLKIISKGYICYLSVIGEGFLLFLSGKQKTPWDNYLFEPEQIEAKEDEIEPFSEDLIKANLLDEEENLDDFGQDDVKEGNKDVQE